MTGKQPNSGQEPLYDTISRILRHNITSGRLPDGLVLIEGPIAKVMQTSRAPVQASLRMLNAEGLFTGFGGAAIWLAPPCPGFALSARHWMNSTLKFRPHPDPPWLSGVRGSASMTRSKPK